MNIALPAVIVILGLLPGIIFFHGYFAGRFTRQLAGLAGVSEFALYILFAVPLDGLARIVSKSFGRDLDFTLIAQLLTAEDKGKAAESLARSLELRASPTILAYVSILVFAYAFASFLRRLVWSFRLDLIIGPLKMKHEWYYLLLGRDGNLVQPIIPYADVMVELAGESKLYQGVVCGFEVGADGMLARLTLEKAQRGNGKGDDFVWKPIPGEAFIISGDSIQSINMRYVEIRPDTSPDRISRTQHVQAVIERWWRRFYFEEA